MEAGSVAIVYLVNPKERYWGLLKRLDTAGATIRGIDIASFEDWSRQVAAKSGSGIGLTTMFFPTPRIEKIILDEPSGGGVSMAETFERIVGAPVTEYLR